MLIFPEDWFGASLSPDKLLALPRTKALFQPAAGLAQRLVISFLQDTRGRLAAAPQETGLGCTAHPSEQRKGRQRHSIHVSPVLFLQVQASTKAQVRSPKSPALETRAALC